MDGAFRKKKVYFSQVSNYTIRDNKLSLKAKGLYSLIQSYITIEDFILYKTTLKKECSEGELAFQNAWNELKKAGYLIQYKNKTKEGFFAYEYDLLDDNHISVSDPVDNPLCGDVGVSNKTNKKNTKLNNTELKITAKKKDKLTKQEKISVATYDFARVEYLKEQV